jgi:hypothetical protein
MEKTIIQQKLHSIPSTHLFVLHTFYLSILSPVNTFLLFPSSFLLNSYLLNNFSMMDSHLVYSYYRLHLNSVPLFLLIILSVSFPLSPSLLFRLSFFTICPPFPYLLPLFIYFSLSLLTSSIYVFAPLSYPYFATPIVIFVHLF